MLVLVVGCGVATAGGAPVSSAVTLVGHVESGTPGPDSVTAFGAAATVPGTTLDRLAAPVVGTAANPDGKGYCVVAADGGISAFGDAAFEDSDGGTPKNTLAVGITGRSGGYWIAYGVDPRTQLIPAIADYVAGVNDRRGAGTCPASGAVGQPPSQSTTGKNTPSS